MDHIPDQGSAPAHGCLVMFAFIPLAGLALLLTACEDENAGRQIITVSSSGQPGAFQPYVNFVEAQKEYRDKKASYYRRPGSPDPAPKQYTRPIPEQKSQPEQNPKEKQKSLSEYVYVGSSKALTYHLPSCKWALKILPKNRVEFLTEAEAREKFYGPCRECCPVNK